MIGIAFSLISEENIHISLKFNICILSSRVKWAPKEIKDHLDFMAKREVWITKQSIHFELST